MSSGLPAWAVERDKFMNPPPQKSALEKYPPRRFICSKVGEDKEITFVDDPLNPSLIPLVEYQIPLNGVWAKTVYLTADANNPTDPLVVRYGNEYRQSVVYSTIINNTGYVSKKTNEAVCHELQLFPMRTATMQSLLKESQENEGALEHWQVTMSKLAEKTSAVVRRRRKKIPNLFKSRAAFNVVRYGGKLLQEWFDDAEKNPEIMRALRNTFLVETEGDGRLVRKIPVFNYNVILAPKSPEEIAQVLGLSSTAPLGGAFGSTVGPAIKSNRVEDPFGAGEVLAGDMANINSLSESDIPF